MVALALERVTHVYGGGVRALDGVDLHIGPGERLAILGQNGSGKSTLVRHLNGLLRPTSGRVLHDGEDVARHPVAALARRVGLAFQDPDRQIFSATARSEVAFGPRNLGLRCAALDAAVEAALAQVGLSERADANPYDLLPTQRKLLTIASVLAMRTPVLVLDEPTTGQDLRGVAVVQQVIEAVAGEGRTVIAISHDMEFVAAAFARVVVLRAGRVILDGSPSEVFGEPAWPALRSTYLEPPLAARIGARLGIGDAPTIEGLVSALAASVQAD